MWGLWDTIPETRNFLDVYLGGFNAVLNGSCDKAMIVYNECVENGAAFAAPIFAIAARSEGDEQEDEEEEEKEELEEEEE